MEFDSPESLDAFRETTLKFLAAGGKLGDLYQYSDTDYEAVYVLGHNFYSQGRYEDALKAFGFLMTNNHWDRRFVFSFAACCQMLKRYEEAVRCYTMASVMDIDDPVPSFHTAECLIMLGMKKEAAELFAMVIDQCGPQHVELKGRAEGLRAMLLQKMPEGKGS